MWEDEQKARRAMKMAIENPLGQEMAQAERAYDVLIDFFVNYSMQVVGALLILAIGYFVARSISRWIVNFLTSKRIDVTLSRLLGSITYFAVLFCFIVIALGKFGISITPFVAALGAFTLGAGLAVQGVVGNYGAGFSIIFTRPFVVGNTLTVQGVSGIVDQIHLAYTILLTEDGEKITIPNKEIIGQILENSFEHKLVETIINIDLASDPRQTIKVLQQALATSELIAKDPPVQIGINDFKDSVMEIGIRCWVKTSNYYQSKYAINATIYDALENNNLRLGLPKQEVLLTSTADSQK